MEEHIKQGGNIEGVEDGVGCHSQGDINDVEEGLIKPEGAAGKNGIEDDNHPAPGAEAASETCLGEGGMQGSDGGAACSFSPSVMEHPAEGQHTCRRRQPETHEHE